ncbi:MAG: hypothetical protein AB8B63_05070 [Granulosicoccus sp.]
MKALCTLAALSILVACSSDTPTSETGDPGNSVFPEQYSDASVLPEGLQRLQQNQELLVQVPPLVNVRTLADSGLHIAYTQASQFIDAPAETIQLQWNHMQQCLQLTPMPPTVLVTQHEVGPFLADDLVLLHYNVPVASATINDYHIIQISSKDFDGSFGDSGFYLRSIFGRYLWQSANLAVSDYPVECAMTPSP